MSTFGEDEVQDLERAALRASIFAMLVAHDIKSVSISHHPGVEPGSVSAEYALLGP
jgi:hypothetical protein